ncbi:hypothetical protein SteCoe_39300 [Stentor coeruleus]|uniref:Uncharacterized protein n=1 Tax=Stentor coeruleus TaxID=5963 RepID=A0A1R2AKQ0_9CILI|nr:hypothetical protein SteCoe_39300 [Stentor coeruleus]
MIIMLNMIISILGDVFDEFQLNAEIYNYTEMAQVISETEQIISYFSSIENYKYIHACIYAYETTGTEWKGRVIDLRDYLKDDFFMKYLKPSFDENQKQISEETKAIENKFEVISEEVKAVSEETKNVKAIISGEVKSVSEEVKTVSEETKSIKAIISGEVKTSMNDLKNRVDDIEKSISNIQGNIELVLKILNK